MLVFVRGGGDLASGVALRLHRVGFNVVVSELPQPLAVRRLVSFAEAVYRGKTFVEEVQARRVDKSSEISVEFAKNRIPVLVDPEGSMVADLSPNVIVDGRMMKQPPDYSLKVTPFIIGLGPGFTGGVNCHAAIETNRGHRLGRVIWDDTTEIDTGVPETVMNHQNDRVLRAPTDGTLVAHANICDHIESGQLVAEINGEPVYTPFKGVLRGIIHPGVNVWKGLKIGDVDPRDDPTYCKVVSDKSLAIAGGVLEAILSRPELRNLIKS